MSTKGISDTQEDVLNQLARQLMTQVPVVGASTAYPVPGGMGLGDAKLAASVGAALGWISWQSLLTGTFAAFALAAVYGGALLVLHRATRTSHLPLGPFILIGTLAAIAL